MNDLKIVTYSSDYKNKWDDFLKSSKNGTFLFFRDFMDYHQDRFNDASLMVFKNDKLFAVFPANKAGKTIYSHQGLTYGGLLVGSKLKLHSILACFKSVLQYYEEHGFINVQIKLIPNIYNAIPSDEMLYMIHVLNGSLIRRDLLSVINQKFPLKYAKDRLDGIKRGEKAGLIIKEDDEFDAFWNSILIPNLKNKHAVNPVHTLEEIKLLKQYFPENIKQYNVYENDRIVAGTTIFISKEVAHSQYISADQDKNITGSLDFLHNYLLTDVFKHKSYFDFGVSNENNGLNVNSGLQYWKEGFGARGIAQDFYQLKIANYTRLDNVLI